MKNVIVSLLMFLTISVSAQVEKSKSEVMSDSLWKSAKVIMDTTIKYLCKEKVTQKDIDGYLKYVYKHMKDSVQISVGFSLPILHKDSAIVYLEKELSDMLGKKTTFKFDGWDGYDGKTPFTGVDFNILHSGYADQFLVVVSTKNRISHISSENSRQ